ncbi:MAG: hypothetical protein KDD35_12230, partial [Bdellovibrionales bacterium]|nr:hypothetical protein [Bdellovibrionales bacterium]
VLDPNLRPIKISEERVKNICAQAMKVLPPVPFELLETYKQEKDLIAFLNVSDVAAEREIYRASPEGAIIHRIRPPFYRVLQATEEEMERFVSRVSLDDWVLSLFNVNRDERSIVDKHFSNKQKFMFIEKLKTLDANKPEARQVGLVRERIARLYVEFQREQNENSLPKEDEEAEKSDIGVDLVTENPLVGESDEDVA